MYALPLDRSIRVFLLLLAAILAGAVSARAQTPGPVIGVSARVPDEARTAATLGTERSGSGVVIDDDGLVLTVGYLIMEAREVTLDLPDGRSLPASIVAYDYDSGFGVLRAAAPVKMQAARLGNSDTIAADARLSIVAGGMFHGAPFPVLVVDRRDFAGYWEYLLENAIFTSPPFPGWGGAALMDKEDRLVGIGSLLVRDAARASDLPGNMFIPINRIRPILADLLASGRVSAPPRPWLGLYMRESPSGLIVTHVAPDGPAAKSGIEAGDRVVEIGGVAVDDLPSFYRAIWAAGEAGAVIELDLRRGEAERNLRIISGDRYKYLRLDNSL